MMMAAAASNKLSAVIILFATIFFLTNGFSPSLIGRSHQSEKCGTFRVYSIPRNDGSDANPNLLSSSSNGEEQVSLNDIFKLLQAQQKQINQLATVWTKSNQSPPVGLAPSPRKEPPPTPQIVPPLKAMLFIDGTWLYYSIHERGPRDCPLIAKFGRGWQRYYAIDWNVLPGIINKHLTKAVRRFSERPLEIVRSSVFTSYKANTSPATYRYKLFEDLKTANYDVHMMETVGKSEKCVDIQLAVEMLHHATDSGGSYDIAILLTGDKDFIPAIIRTRQKGKLFSLVSMKMGCNRALVDLPGMRDFDVLWLDDHLDELVYQKDEANVSPMAMLPMDEYTVNKVTHDFIAQSGFDKVSSRDLGRYLKTQSIGGISFLNALKDTYGSIYHYLASDEAYIVTHDVEKEDSNFWISLSSDGPRRMRQLEEKAKLSEAEKSFFRNYSTDELKHKDIFYARSLVQDGSFDDYETIYNSQGQSSQQTNGYVSPVEKPSSKYDESSTKVELKEACRELGLKVSGTKAELLERIREQEKKEQNQSLPALIANGKTPGSAEEDSHLVNLVVEYLHANGGTVGSRAMGRYLAANRIGNGPTALVAVKGKFGSLSSFLLTYRDMFGMKPMAGVTSEFEIFMKRS